MTEHRAKRRKIEPEGGVAEEPPQESSSALLELSQLNLLAPASPASPPSVKYTCKDLVTLVVGPEKQKLVAYGHRLARTSQFFTTEFQKELLEGQTRVICFPEKQINTVTRYLDFVCGEGLPTDHTVTYDDLEPYEDAYFHLFQLYTFGERVLDAEVQRAVVTETFRLSSLQSVEGERWLPEERAISVIHQGTPAESPARRMLVDLQLSFGLAHSLESDTYDPTYLGDVARAFNQCVQSSDQTNDFRSWELSADDYLV
ncbi:hypothetical protein Q7P35_002557 [Cladosporium inversicolor]